jgi:hypothetical protein
MRTAGSVEGVTGLPLTQSVSWEKLSRTRAAALTNLEEGGDPDPTCFHMHKNTDLRRWEVEDSFPTIGGHAQGQTHPLQRCGWHCVPPTSEFLLSNLYVALLRISSGRNTIRLL